jgi:hypothetical protein
MGFHSRMRCGSFRKTSKKVTNPTFSKKVSHDEAIVQEFGWTIICLQTVWSTTKHFDQCA